MSLLCALGSHWAVFRASSFFTQGTFMVVLRVLGMVPRSAVFKSLTECTNSPETDRRGVGAQTKGKGTRQGVTHSTRRHLQWHKRSL